MRENNLVQAANQRLRVYWSGELEEEALTEEISEERGLFVLLSLATSYLESIDTDRIGSELAQAGRSALQSIGVRVGPVDETRSDEGPQNEPINDDDYGDLRVFYEPTRETPYIVVLDFDGLPTKREGHRHCLVVSPNGDMKWGEALVGPQLGEEIPYDDLNEGFTDAIYQRIQQDGVPGLGFAPE